MKNDEQHAHSRQTCTQPWEKVFTSCKGFVFCIYTLHAVYLRTKIRCLTWLILTCPLSPRNFRWIRSMVRCFFFHGFTGRPEVEFGVFTLRDCQQRCMDVDGCKGIEFSMNRCEIWMRDIRAVKYIDPSVGNFTCMAYGV